MSLYTSNPAATDRIMIVRRPQTRPAHRIVLDQPAPQVSRPVITRQIAGVMFWGLTSILLASVTLQSLSAAAIYQIADLKDQLATATIAEQTIQGQVDTLKSPQHLVARAQQLGMVPSTSAPVFVKVSTSQTFGVATPTTATTPTQNLVSNEFLHQTLGSNN